MVAAILMMRWCFLGSVAVQLNIPRGTVQLGTTALDGQETQMENLLYCRDLRAYA